MAHAPCCAYLTSSMIIVCSVNSCLVLASATVASARAEVYVDVVSGAIVNTTYLSAGIHPASLRRHRLGKQVGNIAGKGVAAETVIVVCNSQPSQVAALKMAQSAERR